ncbi:hypothetical protein AGMMS49936_06750 [Endomicrobiia bacterium]|nr:hypothetical protein AGMMS49936_06750 [Endomicrobiia bacterium]
MLHFPWLSVNNLRDFKLALVKCSDLNESSDDLEPSFFLFFPPLFFSDELKLFDAPFNRPPDGCCKFIDEDRGSGCGGK